VDLYDHAPQAFKEHEYRLQQVEPEINQYVGIALLAVTIAIMAGTAEWVSRPWELADAKAK